MRIKAYSRDERKVQILAVLAIQAQHGKEPCATMYQIAKKLDMSPSSHLTSILKEMKAAGSINGELQIHRPGVVKMVWYLMPGSYQLPMEVKREIPITVRGKSAGVFSL